MRPLIGELLRFGGVGALATLSHGLVYLLISFAVAPQLANLLGYAMAVSISYVGHGRFSFVENRKSSRHRNQVWRFLLVSLVGLALNACFVAFCTHALDAPHLAFWFICTATPILTFVLLKSWVYR